MPFKVVLGWLLLCAAATSAAAAEQALELTTGVQYRHSVAQAVTRAAVGDPKLLSVHVLSAHEILLTPKSHGSTNLLLWTRRGPVQEYAVTIKPAELGSTAIDAGQAGTRTVLQGASPSLPAHAHTLDLAGADTTVDATEQNDVQVQTDIRIVEISRTELKQAGLFFGINRSALTFATGAAGSFQGVDNSNGVFSLLSSNGFLSDTSAHSIVIGRARSQVLGTISALQSNGFAYTLAEPSLVSLSGQSATFLAGGEFPFPSSNRNGDIQIQFKEFGVRLQLTPTVIDAQRIMLKVAPEVSELDFTHGVRTGGVEVPGLRIRRTDTSIQLAPGESFIISGLVSTDALSQADKFPGLGDLPVIGAFFRSTHFSRENRELIMIVTPHLVAPISAGTVLPEPAAAYRNYTPSFGDMLFGDSTHPTGSRDIGFSR